MRQIEFLAYAVSALERLGIPYAIVGSYASTAWGEPRMTRDIDIVIQLGANQVDSLCVAFPDENFYVSRAAASEAVSQHSQFNLIHPSSGNKIGFMIVDDNAWSKSQLARRQQVTFEPGILGYVAAPEDVILGKLVYYREGNSEKHVRDIRGILKVSGDSLDMAYLTNCAAKLGVSDEWKSVLVAQDGTH